MTPMDQYEFKKHFESEWTPLSASQLKAEIGAHVVGVETTIAIISMSGETGYFVEGIKRYYRKYQSAEPVAESF
jgi:hypothetical protein